MRMRGAAFGRCARVGKKRLALKRELGRAEAVRIHCASSAAQARFTMERDRFLASSDRDEKLLCLERMRRAAESEAAHARELRRW